MFHLISSNSLLDECLHWFNYIWETKTASVRIAREASNEMGQTLDSFWRVLVVR